MRIHKSWQGLLTLLSVLALSGPATAHHGTAVSYDMGKLIYTDAVVIQYTFSNPHPRFMLEIPNEKGELQRWDCEGGGNPAMILRWGWSRAAIEKALQPGAKIKVGVSPSRSNPTSGLVLEIFDDAGKPILLSMPKDKAYDYPGPGERAYRGPGG